MTVGGGLDLAWIDSSTLGAEELRAVGEKSTANVSAEHPNQVRGRVGSTTVLATVGVVLTAGWLLVPDAIYAWSSTATLGWYAATMVVPGVLAIWALRRAVTDGLQVALSIDGNTEWDDFGNDAG